MKLSSNPVFHAITSHIELDYHFIREKVEEGENNWHNSMERKLGKGPYRLRPAIPEKRPNKTFF